MAFQCEPTIWCKQQVITFRPRLTRARMSTHAEQFRAVPSAERLLIRGGSPAKYTLCLHLIFVWIIGSDIKVLTGSVSQGRNANHYLRLAEPILA